MKILMVGHGAGSWRMRGEQLGAALGARVVCDPTPADLAWADVAIAVKRAAFQHGPSIRAAGVPLVWDALDFWAQPNQNAYDVPAAKELLARTIAQVKPDLVIGATMDMADDAGGLYLPHHGYDWPTPVVRERIQTIGYLGRQDYLGRWAGWIASECAYRGWRFLCNPPPADFGLIDVLVALRDGTWDGYMCRRWKSGVKVVNAVLAGRPLITQPNAAVEEIDPPEAQVITAFDQFVGACDALTVDRRRLCAAVSMDLAKRYTVTAIAQDYRMMLGKLIGVAA